MPKGIPNSLTLATQNKQLRAENAALRQANMDMLDCMRLQAEVETGKQKIRELSERIAQNLNNR